MSKQTDGTKTLALNRKARHLYEISDSFECGIVLKGTEVKSLRLGKFTFTDAYAKIDKGELWLVGVHITPYAFGNRFNHEPDRLKKLLVHKQELKRLKRKTDEKGLTLVPLRFYLKKGIVKLELGLGRGKKQYDKREDIKRRDLKRDAERELRNKY